MLGLRWTQGGTHFRLYKLLHSVGLHKASLESLVGAARHKSHRGVDRCGAVWMADKNGEGAEVEDPTAQAGEVKPRSAKPPAPALIYAVSASARTCSLSCVSS